MTREDLIAAAEALEEMAEHLDGLHLLQSRDECLKKARELRAQAEAMPRIVREGRDFDVKFHDNGAATSRKDGTRSDGKSALESAAAAAPPSAAQPVAQVVCNPDGSDKRVIFHSHRALYETPLGTFLYAAPPSVAPPSVEPVAWNHACNALCTHIDLWIPQCPHCGKPRTAPPDLAARVKELEAALQDERYTVANLYERIAALEAELARAKEAVTELRAMEQNTAELHHKTHNDLVAVRAECDTACEELRNLVDRYEERVIERDAARAECERLKREVMILAGMSADAIDAARKEGK